MTPQEQQMLQGLIERINQTQLPEKDLDAEQLLQQTLGRNPDALYILAQTVLVQQYALDQAQKQLDQLRQQQQPKRATSFLGSLLGGNDEPERPAPPPPPPPQYSQPQYTPVPNYPPPASYAPAYGAPQSGGFLRSALQTATGVAAGALAFQGIESLMHGFGHTAGYGSGLGSFGESDRPETINNYYGDASPHEHSEHLSPDIEDRRGESRFSEAVDKNDHGDSLMDTNNTSDTNDFADDSSNFDDSSDLGSDFDSGGGDDSSF
ncbi:MAG: putative periplasmic ligand-binding sensor protein [Edaphobacter sp.]|nr:putative periplasmic ligand-binding sensor protein [Edaphobacter sp.]MCU1319833.1 putative periplasmic ligand-binding sensor protein [Edaphobacter sp.]